jgi:hypothetical protein
VPFPQGWLHPGLSVLMNVTHNNEAGREAVAAGGGLEALAQLVACCAAPALQAGAVLDADSCSLQTVQSVPDADSHSPQIAAMQCY